MSAVLSFGQAWENEKAEGPTLADRARAARAQTEKKRRRGELALLGINPATGKRFINTGRSPSTGIHSRLLPVIDAPAVSLEGRFRSRRERAAELHERMLKFSAIYNAGWLVRDAYFGSDQRQHDAVMAFIAVVLQELRTTQDYEACLFAVADTLTCSAHGLPWEP
jgi:hypothetical protein